jgi:LysM repeat protein
MPGLDLIMQQVKAKMDERKFADALLILSQVYDNPDVPPAQARKITDILDQMAAKVIYSREHLLEPVYYAQQGDTLDTVADRYQVPPLLLARINGLRDQNLSPGTKLKVLKGPFSAYVSIDRAELTMKLSGRYAGRFPISLSNDLQQQSGLYTVSNKSRPAATADKLWIELSNVAGKIGIEGAADARSAARTARSTIWLSEQDMDDVYGILSVSSRVVIQR